MDNSSTWHSLLLALDSTPYSTSSEISFPYTAKAIGATSGDQEQVQECIINFSMNPLSEEWKNEHTERSPDIKVLDNLAAVLPEMEEEEIKFGEKRTWVVGGAGGWRAINAVVELAGIELEREEEEDEQVERTGEDAVMEDTNSDAVVGGDCASENGSSFLGKGTKRGADSQDSDDESTTKDVDATSSAKDETTDTKLFEQPPDIVAVDHASHLTSKTTDTKSKRPKKKKRRANHHQATDPTSVNTSVGELHIPTISTPTTTADAAHLIEIARLCELMSKPTPSSASPPPTSTSTSAPADSQSSNPNNDFESVPKIRLIRRKANKLQCQRCLDLGTACDTQTPCSPCRRLGRGMCVCRPGEGERDAVREFAFKNVGVGGGGGGGKAEREKKELFFDERGRFCKREEAVRKVEG